MLSKILVGFDDSPSAQKALDMALGLAKNNESSVTLMYVVERPIYLARGGYLGNETGFQALEKVAEEVAIRGIEMLRMKKEEVEKKGVKIEIKLVEGNPGDELIKESGTGAYNVVVVGTRGMGRLKSLLLGSVSNKVVHYSKVPVLLSR